MKSSTMSCTILALHQSKIFKASIWHLASKVTIRLIVKKEKCMPENNNDRVLIRAKARQLTAEEFQKIMDEGSELMTLLPSTPFHPDF